MTGRQDSNRGRTKRNKEEKIKAILENNPEGLSPKAIAQYSGLNHSTVRSYCRELTNKGELENKDGYYSVSEETHKTEPPNIQNLRFKAGLPDDLEFEHWESGVDFPFGNLSVTVGTKNRQATGQFSANPPVSLEAGYLAGRMFIEKISRAVDWRPDEEDVLVTTSEFSWDEYGIRLDGVNAITLRTLGAEDKLYNKEHGLRHEARVLAPLELEDLLGIVENGVTYSQLASKYRKIEEKVDMIHEEYRKSNEAYQKNTKVTKKVLEELSKIKEELNNIENRVQT